MPPQRRSSLPHPARRSVHGRRTTVLGAAVAGTLALTACGGSTQEPAAQDEDATLTVLASFYPLQYVAEQIGGDAVEVLSATPPGIDPHDLELSPRQVREIGDADVVAYLGGFQPSVDEAIAAREPALVLDAATTEAVAAHMEAGDEHVEDEEHAQDEHDEDEAHEDDQAHAEDEHGHEDDDHGHEDDEVHADEEVDAEADDHDHDHAHGEDPHFWLDPTLLAAVGQDLAVLLGEARPELADEFAERADALESDLSALDTELAEGLSQCDRTVIVAAHEAYGFLAERYDLEQVGISGLDPESEPSPARLREIRAVVEEHGVTTIFTESLVNPKVAETLAADLGIDTDVLDPVESQADEATDYRGAMENNLEALRTGLGCA
ncbi:metal ABC transporter substrate-binding protein [Actinotalea sp. C106]|uniref:metal ABC transporter substrate-binding protein n=1 Tax=Actinotalea sp. C106 TaxID=2908644 RepID=UPI002028AB49|nr:metal ABC transporter substrate-binding protein [Actinotalea sp. C106]